jgi:hypothetical protein
MKYSRKQLGDACWQVINHYNKLRIGNVKVKAPYYINNLKTHVFPLMEKAGIDKSLINKFYELYKSRVAPFGWYRGKGTPEELEKAATEIFKKLGFDTEGLSSDLIRELMKLYGIGIDCSGFVYNVLDLGLNKLDAKRGLSEVLDLSKSKNNDVYHVGVESFYGSSEKIDNSSLQSLDLVISKDGNKPDHIGVILEKHDKLYLCQSTLGLPTTGVNVTMLRKNKEKIIFDYRPEGKYNYEELLNLGKVEFRRLYF